MAMSALNDIKKGVALDIDNQPCVVVAAQFVRMQQRKPVMQTKLKNLITGKVLEINFHPGDLPTEADLMHRRASYLYADENAAHFMNSETYDQFGLDRETVGDALSYLIEGTEVDALYFNDAPVAIQIPSKVNLKVTQTVDGAKGDTAQGRVTKPATLETGLEIQVPLFVKVDDTIRVNTDTGEYAERV